MAAVPVAADLVVAVQVPEPMGRRRRALVILALLSVERSVAMERLLLKARLAKFLFLETGWINLELHSL